MGLAVLLGVFFVLSGISFLAGAIVFIFLAKKQKKKIFYILSGVSFVVGIPFLAIGIYVVYEFLRYLGVVAVDSSSYKIVDECYGIFDPEYKTYSMFAHVLKYKSFEQRIVI